MKRLLWIPWVWWRRAAQLALLAGFLWLFRHTQYSGKAPISGADNLIFRLDPLVAASAMLAAKKLVWLCWPAAVIVVLTLVLGRFFCGWVCPLGTLLDYFHRLLRPITRRTNGMARALLGTALLRLRPARYFLLVLVLLAAVLAVPLVGYLDPFSLLVRAMTFKGDPVLYTAVNALLGWTDDRWGTAGVHQFIVKHVLPSRQAVFDTAGVSAAIVAILFALELVARRFWCRYLCPLGAGLGLLARPSLVKRLPVRVCRSCGNCAGDCRMGAIEGGAGFSPEGCNLCMECVDNCPSGIVKFAPQRSALPPAPVDFSRRGLLGAAAAGVIVPALIRAGRLGHGGYVDPTLLRPPGAADEKTFLDLCVRCGECMKICPTNVLQPTILQAGIEGMFSPRLAPRVVLEQSCCDYTCTLCGQVCPTGAIPRLIEAAKHKHPTGKAWFDHGRCLPWARDAACTRCEEMCPVPEKAIRVRGTYMAKDDDGNDVEIQQPFVDRDLCVGCGTCESVCPVEGAAGIRVRRVDAPNPGTEFKDRAGPAATGFEGTTMG